ncbi:uncharacterized protein LOC142972432 [Anticarsia gemmatalis]|uniref:uncharacterized protein LOC142972432 n=1 Tax=Anticarsia gemmatalis TaxID=129554 RepID=UPI003F769BAD
MTTGLDRNSFYNIYKSTARSNMYQFIVFSFYFGFLTQSTDCTSSFDQRQTGDLNVQIGLKNIHLIALLNGGNEEYVDYDYAYDYSEMTIKPQNGTTTQKPLNVTNTQNTQIQNNATLSTTVLADNTTEQSTVAADQSINVTNVVANHTESINSHNSDSNATATVKPVISEVIVNTTTNAESIPNIEPTTAKVTVGASTTTTVLPDSSNDTNATSLASGSKCRRGFVQNHQGKCEYKVHGTSNALRRIVKLAQKIKIGRGLTET